ncbi:MAG: type restriction enzyme protein [Candidatus Petromonas sp.]|jgi:type I restriction enzyme M protein|nr:type restriction enzyme protein [Candidatus Petromonas sp.]
MAVLRRFDSVLAATKQQVLERYEMLKKSGLQNMDHVLNRISKQEFNNTSKYDFEKLLADPDNIANNLRNYIRGTYLKN